MKSFRKNEQTVYDNRFSHEDDEGFNLISHAMGTFGGEVVRGLGGTFFSLDVVISFSNKEKLSFLGSLLQMDGH